MLGKDALQEIENPGLVFYSSLFLVQKVSGGPVIDLSFLSNFVMITEFKMETILSVLGATRNGDNVRYLKDSYFQILICLEITFGLP